MPEREHPSLEASFVFWTYAFELLAMATLELTAAIEREMTHIRKSYEPPAE